jgi:hypothetical protein
MPHFTISLTQGVPMIDLFVMASAARRVALQAANAPLPPPQKVRGLVDTGASHTCIDPSVFQALQLQPTGSVPMHTPSTAGVPMSADTYDVGILIPGPTTSAPLLIPNMQVSATDLFLAQGFHALIGRDILGQCILTHNGSAKIMTFAY